MGTSGLCHRVACSWLIQSCDRRNYNLVYMADHIVCSCVTCPRCGTWVVLPSQVEIDRKQSKGKIVCAAPDCAREFVFDWDEARTFELPLGLFERRHFYRSELQSTST